MSPTILGIALTIILIKFNLANSQNANQKPFDENQLFSDVVYMNTQNFINSKKKKNTRSEVWWSRRPILCCSATTHLSKTSGNLSLTGRNLLVWTPFCIHRKRWKPLFLNWVLKKSRNCGQTKLFNISR